MKARRSSMEVSTVSAVPSATFLSRVGLWPHSAKRLLRVAGFEHHERLRLWTVGTTKTATRRRSKLEKSLYEDSLRQAERYRAEHSRDPHE